MFMKKQHLAQEMAKSVMAAKNQASENKGFIKSRNQDTLGEKRIVKWMY
jgi:hypothetical protein